MTRGSPPRRRPGRRRRTTTAPGTPSSNPFGTFMPASDAGPLPPSERTERRSSNRGLPGRQTHRAGGAAGPPDTAPRRPPGSIASTMRRDICARKCRGPRRARATSASAAKKSPRLGARRARGRHLRRRRRRRQRRGATSRRAPPGRSPRRPRARLAHRVRDGVVRLPDVARSSVMARRSASRRRNPASPVPGPQRRASCASLGDGQPRQ